MYFGRFGASAALTTQIPRTRRCIEYEIIPASGYGYLPPTTNHPPPTLDRGNTVDFDERVARNAARCSNRGADRRRCAESSEIRLVHAGVILQIVQIHIHF